MRGVIYARYSSDNQREESIEGQIRDCEAYAKRNDIVIIDQYIDRAFSAKTDNRPAFQQMIKDSSKKQFDVILVWKLDRFARNRYDSAHYKAQLKKNGVRVLSATETISGGADGILLETVLEGMAEYYSAELAEKVNRGMRENALKCKFNGGTKPVGFVIDEERHFKPNPLYAPLILKAFEMYSNGYTMLEITNMLNHAGVMTDRKTKMTINSVTRMLHNRIYIGEYKYGDVVIPNAIPAIVPINIFEAVQKRLEKVRKAPAASKSKEGGYLLTTKLYCGKCNRLMVGESGTSKTGNTYYYYKCVGNKKRLGCDKKAVKKDWIEELVIRQIKTLINDDDVIDKLSDKVIKALDSENTVLLSLEKQLNDINKGIENIVDAIQQGIILPSTKERLTALENEKKSVEIEIAKEKITKPKLTKKEITFWFRRYRNLDISKTENRIRLVDTFLNSVYLYDDRLVFTFNYEKGTKTILYKDIEESGLSSNSNTPTVPKKSSLLAAFFNEIHPFGWVKYGFAM